MAGGGTSIISPMLGFAGSMMSANNTQAIGNMRAAAARAQIPGIFGMATLDINNVNVQMKRQLGELSRQLITTAGAQRAQAAGSGFSVGSNSFMSVMAATRTDAERRADNLRIDAEIQRQRIWYSAQLQANQLENQARIAQFSASASASQQRFSGASRLFTSLLGSAK